MTPFEIEILMHYQTRAGDFRNGDFSAAILPRTLDNFLELSLLRLAGPGDPTDQRYAATEATAVYIDALCAVPAPVQRWVIP